MSRTNVERHREVCDCFNRRDFDDLGALMDDDVEYAPRTMNMDGGGCFHGPDEVLRSVRDYLSVFPDWRMEPVEVRDLGDLTLASLRVSGHGGESHVPVDQSTWHLARWRNGRLLSLTSHESEAEALAAVSK